MENLIDAVKKATSAHDLPAPSQHVLVMVIRKGRVVGYAVECIWEKVTFGVDRVLNLINELSGYGEVSQECDTVKATISFKK